MAEITQQEFENAIIAISESNGSATKQISTVIAKDKNVYRAINEAIVLLGTQITVSLEESVIVGIITGIALGLTIAEQRAGVTSLR